MSDEFWDIANSLVDDEANDYLDARMAAMDNWVRMRQAEGESATLRDLITTVMNEPNQRGPVIVALCTAMWRLREMSKHADQ